MTRYLFPGILLSLLVALTLLYPRDGNAGSGRGSLTIVYTGDVVGTVEPCG